MKKYSRNKVNINITKTRKNSQYCSSVFVCHQMSSMLVCKISVSLFYGVHS